METPSIPPRPRRRWPIWKKFLAGMGLGLLAVVLWLFLSPDEPPPDVSDLTVVQQPLKLSDDQNAYTIIIKAAALVKADHFKDHEAQLNDMVNGKNWDAALARQWLDGTDAIWPLWAQAARTPEGQAPLRTAVHRSLTPVVKAIGQLNRLAQIRAWDLARNGQPDAAIESLLTALQVAQRLEQSRGDSILYFAANGSKRMALDSLLGIATEFKPSPANLRQALQQVAATRPDKAAFANLLHQDFQWFSLGLENPARAFVRPEDSDMVTHLIITTGTHVPRLFKPNKTRRIYAEVIRYVVRSIDRDIAANRADLPPVAGDLLPVEALWNIGGARQSVSGVNLLGRIIVSSASAIPVTSGVSRLKAQSNVSAHEAFLALVLYHREHGELPATLDALVPTYLPAVPRDYFDGQPIRYSREFRAVWSVGTDNFKLISARPNQEKTRDQIYLPLDFAAPQPNPTPAPAATTP